jgi:hypothetical protein
MEEPSLFATVVRILIIILVGLVLPQLLGFIGYIYTLKRKLIFKIVALLFSPVLYFGIATLFWNMQAANIRAKGHYACGALGAAASFSILYGTLMHLILSIIISLITYYIWKRRSIASGSSRTNTAATDIR